LPASAPDTPAQRGAAAEPGLISPVVVSDAGPLIALGRLDLLHVLGVLFTQVQVPEVVIAECLARPGNPDTRRIRSALDSGLLQATGGNAQGQRPAASG
jgi:hypothetical protein